MPMARSYVVPWSGCLASSGVATIQTGQASSTSKGIEVASGDVGGNSVSRS